MPDYSNYNARTYEKYGEIWRNTGKCVFCDLREKYIIHEIDNVVLTVNLFPYIVGHLLIIPRRHIEAFSEVSDEEFIAIRKLSVYGENLLKEKLKIGQVWFMFRMNGGFSGQKTVPHVHAHLIPFNVDLFKWEYQYIDVSPEDLAKKLRN